MLNDMRKNVLRTSTHDNAHARFFLSLGLARTSLGQCFKDAESAKVKNWSKSYYVVHDQRSLMSRRRATRTCTILHQVEMLSVFAASQLVLPRRRRAIYDTLAVTNEGDTIGPVMLPLWSTSWTMTFGKKKELFTGQNRPAVGGPTDGTPQDDEQLLMEREEEDEWKEVEIVEDALPGIAELAVNPGRANAPVRSDSNDEVVFFHSWPEALYTELMHSFCLKGVLDLTCGSGMAALAAIKARSVGIERVRRYTEYCKRRRAHDL